MRHAPKLLAALTALALVALALWTMKRPERREAGVSAEALSQQRELGALESHDLEPDPTTTPTVDLPIEREPVGSVTPVQSAAEPAPSVEAPRAPGLAFHARVVARESGLPVPGAQVVAGVDEFERWMLGETGPAPRAATSTDAQGYLLVEVDPEEPVYCRIDADGFGPAFEIPVPGHEQRSLALVIELVRGARLEGWVVDQTGRPVDGVRVEVECDGFALAPEASTIPSAPVWTAKVDAEGGWSLADLPPDVELRVEYWRADKHVSAAEAYFGGLTPLSVEPEPLVLAPGETRTLELVLGSGATIRGRAVFAGSGEPLVDHDIWLLGKRFEEDYVHVFESKLAVRRTGVAGEFEFEGLKPGKWFVAPAPMDEFMPSAARGRAVPAAIAVRIEPGVANVEVVLEVERGEFIEGTVVDPAGRPVADVQVCAISSSARIFIETTAEDGSFRFGPLLHEEYEVQAEPAGELSGSVPVFVMPGAGPVILALHDGATLRGRVFEGGRPTWAEIVLSSSMGLVLERTQADAQCRFELSGLVPGAYVVFAETGEKRSRVAKLHLDPGAVVYGVRLELEPGAILLLEYRGAHPAAAVQVQVDGAYVGYGFVERGGSDRLILPPGPVTLAVHLGARDGTTSFGELPSISVELVAGEETTVEIGEP